MPDTKDKTFLYLESTYKSAIMHMIADKRVKSLSAYINEAVREKLIRDGQADKI